MTDALADRYGRTESEWDELTYAGLAFLVEQARLGRRTSYTEFNHVMNQRTGLRLFDFDLEGERAAIGELLYRIVEANRPESGLMISALVWYLNDNDAGPGFYGLAQQYGVLPADASPDDKLRFWFAEVERLHAHYRRRRSSRAH